MMRKTAWILGALAVAVLLAVSPASSHGGGKHARHMMIDGERIDLADLADGETRTFGEGEHQITAAREGDLITIAVGDTEMVSDFTCDAAEDNCFVIRSGDDDAVKLMVTKGGEGHGHMEQQVMVMALGDREHDSDHEFFFSDEDGEQVNVMVSTHGEGGHWVSKDDGQVRVIVTRDGESDPHVNRILLRADAATLRCPEGDTTMRLQEGDEDEGPFYCPKHDIKLEKVDRRKLIREIHTHDDEDD
jgi:hypothetical protein